MTILNNTELEKELRISIHDVPDFPKNGVIFKDINPLLRNPVLLKKTIAVMAEAARHVGAEHIVGIESRGFFFGVPLALELNLPFVAVRKKGKLPGNVVTESYSLEYGSDAVEIQSNALKKGGRYFIVDDVIATGGTASAAAKIVQRGQGEVSAFCFLIELGFLDGKKILQQFVSQEHIYSLLKY